MFPPVQKPRASGMTGVGDIGRQRRKPAFSGDGIKIIYLLAPHYPVLASLGLSLIPLVGSSRPPRNSGLAPHPIYLEPSVSDPVSCQSHSLGPLLTLTFMVSPMLGRPLQPQASPLNFWEGVPLQPLRIPSPAGRPQKPVTVFSVWSVPCPAVPPSAPRHGHSFSKAAQSCSFTSTRLVQVDAKGLNPGDLRLCHPCEA